MKSLNRKILVFACSLCVTFFGNTLYNEATDIQDRLVTRACDQKTPTYTFLYAHGLMQTLVLTLSMVLSFGIYWIHKRVRPQYYNTADHYAELTLKPKPKLWMYLVPSVAIVGAFAISFIGFAYLKKTSTYHIGRLSSLIPLVVLFRVRLKYAFKKSQKYSLFIVLIGVCLLFAAQALDHPQEWDKPYPKDRFYTDLGIGIALIAVVVMLVAIQGVAQQQLIHKYSTKPLLVVGYEGLFSSILVIVLILVSNSSQCPNLTICRVYYNGTLYFQSVPAILEEFNSGYTYLFTFLQLIFGSISFATGIQIVKKTNAISRTSIQCLRSMMCWIVGIILTATVDYPQSYRQRTKGNIDKYYWEWQNIHYPQVYLLKALGYTTCFIGCLVLLELVKIRRWRESTSSQEQEQGTHQSILTQPLSY